MFQEVEDEWKGNSSDYSYFISLILSVHSYLALIPSFSRSQPFYLFILFVGTFTVYLLPWSYNIYWSSESPKWFHTTDLTLFTVRAEAHWEHKLIELSPSNTVERCIHNWGAWMCLCVWEGGVTSQQQGWRALSDMSCHRIIKDTQSEKAGLQQDAYTPRR